MGGRGGRRVTIQSTSVIRPSLPLSESGRRESMAYAINRYQSGESPTKTPQATITVYSDGSKSITDGRHRIAAAKRLGIKRIKVTVNNVGPRGGVNRTTKVVNTNNLDPGDNGNWDG